MSEFMGDLISKKKEDKLYQLVPEHFFNLHIRSGKKVTWKDRPLQNLNPSQSPIETEIKHKHETTG